eukprot:1031093-Amorphochlora_amoeboformis.AAC.1
MPPPTRQPQPSAPPLMPLLSQLDNAGHGGIRDDPSVARNSVDMVGRFGVYTCDMMCAWECV